MPIELRIQSGARAGQTETFDKPVIVIGRHPMSDLRFDVKHDLDVSTKHGEIRKTDGRYAIYDLQSTNGTFVNGARVPSGGSQALKTGDTVGFGPHGPTMTVHVAGQAAGASKSGQPRTATGERIALAVRQQTRGLRIAVVGSVVVLGGLAGGTFWMSRRDAARRDLQLKTVIAANDSARAELEKRLRGMDTTLYLSLRRRNDSLMKVVQAAPGERARAEATLALRHEHDLQRQVGAMDLPAVLSANNPAVVLINVEIGADKQEATGFCVTSAGLIVTNRHVVQDSATGAKATRIHVKFANSRQWQPAQLVKIAGGKDVDLALLQVDSPGRAFSTMKLASTIDAPIGGPIAIIGFPNGTSLPMDGDGNDAAATTTPTVGILTKTLANTLQLEAFATHGSSGSPVLDAHGHVIGVVWGGREPGNVVFAVPTERIAQLLKSAK